MAFDSIRRQDRRWSPRILDLVREDDLGVAGGGYSCSKPDLRIVRPLSELIALEQRRRMERSMER